MPSLRWLFLSLYDRKENNNMQIYVLASKDETLRNRLEEKLKGDGFIQLDEYEEEDRFMIIDCEKKSFFFDKAFPTAYYFINHNSKPLFYPDLLNNYEELIIKENEELLLQLYEKNLKNKSAK